MRVVLDSKKKDAQGVKTLAVLFLKFALSKDHTPCGRQTRQVSHIFHSQQRPHSQQNGKPKLCKNTRSEDALNVFLLVAERANMVSHIFPSTVQLQTSYITLETFVIGSLLASL